jgi:hypothetical protein
MLKGSRLFSELSWRLPLCVLAVLICYQFEWTWLRFATSEATLRFVEWCGYPGRRLSPHLIAWNDQRFEFGIGCTFADVFCGAVPLLWIRSAGILRNSAFVIVFAAGLFVFNLLRQATADLIFAAGAPWALADNILGGLSYFAVWVFLIRWLERSFATTPVTAATPSAVVP